METFQRFYYLLLSEEPRVFTYHRNLQFFSPSTLDPSLGLLKVMKVLRWAVFLSQFQYRIEHVDSDEVMADLITLGIRGYRGKRTTIRQLTYLLLEKAVVPSPESNDFDFPTVDQIRIAQSEYGSEKPIAADRDAHALCKFHDCAWIPDQSDDLQFRLLIVAHCGTGGHRNTDWMENFLREQFTWTTLN